MKKRPPRATVRAATLKDLESLYAHLGRHGRESGQGGDIVFSPFEEPVLESYPEFRALLGPRMTRPADETGWLKVFIAVAHEDGGPSSGEIVGELKLVGSHLVSNLHRARLEMGIERGFRGMGLGAMMIGAALDWARGTDSLSWIDLRVFGHNEPARALYEKFGFVERSRIEDVFRVSGQSIEDRAMTLKIR